MCSPGSVRGQSVPASHGQSPMREPTLPSAQTLPWRSLVGGGCRGGRRGAPAADQGLRGLGQGTEGRQLGGRPGFRAPHITCSTVPVWAAKVAESLMMGALPPDPTARLGVVQRDWQHSGMPCLVK